MTNFMERGELMDEQQNRTDSVACLTSACFSAPNAFPRTLWEREFRLASLGLHSIDSVVGDAGTRFAVRV
jgi:hypothetical protein